MLKEREELGGKFSQQRECMWQGLMAGQKLRKTKLQALPFMNKTVIIKEYILLYFCL